MVALGHVYLTMHGDWVNATWLGENGQMGVRMPTTDSTNMPAKGAIFAPLSNGDVVLDTGAQSGTHGILTKAWTARLGPVGSEDNADGDAQIGWAEDCWTFLNTIKSRQSQYWRWTHVKIAPIGTDGKYVAGSGIYTFTTPIVGTGAAPTLPPEVALALSLRAPIIGRRGRGRMYLPGLSSGALLSNDGDVAQGTREIVAPIVAQFVEDLDNAAGVDGYAPIVAVMSAGSPTAVRPTEVRVGSHFDAQRRRQHQVPEVFTAQNL